MTDRYPGSRWGSAARSARRGPALPHEGLVASLAETNVSYAEKVSYARTDTERPHTILTFVFMEQLRRLTSVGIPWLKPEGAKEATLR